jgi:hypothetical protein
MRGTLCVDLSRFWATARKPLYRIEALEGPELKVIVGAGGGIGGRAYNRILNSVGTELPAPPGIPLGSETVQ